MTQLLMLVTESRSKLPLRVGTLCGNQQDERFYIIKSHAMFIIRETGIEQEEALVCTDRGKNQDEQRNTMGKFHPHNRISSNHRATILWSAFRSEDPPYKQKSSGIEWGAPEKRRSEPGSA